MPYPPKHAYSATVPETALEPQLNAIAGGTGNAHTIPATTNQNPSGQPMPPYASGETVLTYSPAVDGHQGYGVDGGNRDFLVSTLGATTFSTAYVGGGTAENIGILSFLVDLPADRDIDSAVLTLRQNDAVTGTGNVTVRAQDSVTVVAPTDTDHALSVAATTASDAIAHGALAGDGNGNAFNVKDILDELRALPGWADSGQRVNFTVRADNTITVLAHHAVEAANAALRPTLVVTLAAPA